MKLCDVAFVVSSLFGLTSASPLEKRSPAAFSSFTHNPVYYPLQQAPLWRVAYARAIQLNDNSLLATWEDYPYGEDSNNLDTFKIIRSTDGGATWKNLSQVHDTQNGWGMRFLGNYKAGTLIIGGVSCPVSLQGGVYIDVYASTDNGATWNFASHIAYGNGPEDVTTGHASIWEPFFLQKNGKLYAYFSDQRDSAHSQKLSLASTSDLRTWSASSDVVSESDPNARPGMAVVSYIPTIKQYILTYEYCNNANIGGCPAYLRLSPDPTNFISAPETLIKTTNGHIPAGSPYTVWYQSSSNAGSIILSTNSDTDFFVSKDNGKTWTNVDKGQYTGQSRHLMLFNDNGKTMLHSITGGFYGCSDSCYNYVANGVNDLSGF